MIVVIENTWTRGLPNCKLGQNFGTEINVKVMAIMLGIVFLISFCAVTH